MNIILNLALGAILGVVLYLTLVALYALGVIS